MTCSNIKPTRSTGPAEVSQNRLLFDRTVKFLFFPKQTTRVTARFQARSLIKQNHHTQIRFFKRIIQETHFDEILKWGVCVCVSSIFFLNKRCSLTPPPKKKKTNHFSITVAGPLLQHNYTGEHTRRLFAVTQCCPEAFLLPSPCQFCKWEERPRLCDGQITDDATVELDAALSQIVHEGRIFHAVLSCCCSNPWDPERPHVALLKFPSFGGVYERPPDSPHGQAVAAVLPASEVPCMLEDLLDLPVSVGSSASDPTRQRQKHHFSPPVTSPQCPLLKE